MTDDDKKAFDLWLAEEFDGVKDYEACPETWPEILKLAWQAALEWERGEQRDTQSLTTDRDRRILNHALRAKGKGEEQ